MTTQTQDSSGGEPVSRKTTAAGQTAADLSAYHGLQPLEPNSHLDHMLRTTRIHHSQLSQMADVKASMILTLASLIITFSIGYLENPVLRLPVGIMIGFCVLTILAAAYAVLPKLYLNDKTPPSGNDANILFFGTFVNMEFEEFTSRINPIFADPTLAYEAQLREIYELGIYLGRKKYRYIRLAYGAFLLGLVLSVLALFVAGGASLVS